MKKKIFKSDEGNIHFGINPPLGYKEGKKEDIAKTLANPEGKKFWRCTVCNDLGISLEPLEECPTCYNKDVYIEIDVEEFNKLMDIL